MFKGLFEIGNLVKQAQELGGKMQEMQERLKSARIKGSAGGGMVEVEINGLQELLGCKIDPALLARQDVELLEELVVAAVNEATAESRRRQAEWMQEATGGMNLPGMEDALKKMMP